MLLRGILVWILRSMMSGRNRYVVYISNVIVHVDSGTT